MNENDIMQSIERILEGTDYKLEKFGRDLQIFGNMTVQIESLNSIYIFITDRGDIFCNNEIIIPHGYHIAGNDDTPINLLKAIETIIRK